MTAYGLTRKQSQLLAFIEKEKARGITPSFEEMMVALDYQSKSSIDRLLTALEERGHVCRIPNRARSISIGASA